MKKKATPEESSNEKPYMTKSIPEGEILTDLKDKKWKLGSSIGIGGFGEIYLASDDLSKPVPYQSDFVVKVEPFMSGPLFVEIHVYAKIGQKELIHQYILNRKLKSLGMPHFLGCGSHYYNNERYRFIVLPKYGIDLQTVFLNSGKQFSIKTAFTLAIYVIDVLEYIHSNGYVHADIKASNLVLDKANQTPVYLLDYGLSCKFYDDIGNHKKWECDQRKAHNGTLMFTSRDAHFGAHSRRGDLEVLGYNLIQWITGSLPWEGNTDAEMVAEYKKRMMSNVRSFISECFNRKHIVIPDALVQYFKYVNKLKFKSKPDYQYCRKLFRQAVRDAGYTFNGDLSLNVNWLQVPRKRHRCISDRENNNKYKVHKSYAVSVPVNPRRPCAVRNINPRLTRKSTSSTVQFDWPKILAGHPEKPNGTLSMYDLPQETFCGISSTNTDSTDSTDSEILYTRGLDNPTPYMKLILERERLKEKSTVLNEDPLPIHTRTSRNKKHAVHCEYDGVIANHEEKMRKEENRTNKRKSISTNTVHCTFRNDDIRKKVTLVRNIPKRVITRKIAPKCTVQKTRVTKKASVLKSLCDKECLQNQRITRKWAHLTQTTT